jgi:hypothetical protein
MTLEDTAFTTYFNKKASANDKAVMSMWFDVAVRLHAKSMLRSSSESLFEGDGTEIHTFRFEIDLATCDYRSLKRATLPSDQIKDFRYTMTDARLMIVDMDEHLGGNEFKRTKQLFND